MKHDIIVFTGMPSAGKTTLINELAKTHSFNMLTMGSDKLPSVKSIEDFHSGARKATKAVLPFINYEKTLVCDRFFIDELIFGYLFNRSFDVSLYDDLAWLHNNYKVCYIVMLCSYDTFTKRKGHEKIKYGALDYTVLEQLYTSQRFNDLTKGATTFEIETYNSGSKELALEQIKKLLK